MNKRVLINEEELRDFCIEHNLPFTVEFPEPWYPKSIEISPSVINDTEELNGIETINWIHKMIK